MKPTLIERIAYLMAAAIVCGVALNFLIRPSGARLVTVHETFNSLKECKQFVDQIPASKRRGECEG